MLNVKKEYIRKKVVRKRTIKKMKVLYAATKKEEKMLEKKAKE